MSFSKMWAQCSLKCMGFVQRKAITSNSKYTVENFSEVREVFLNDMMAVVVMAEVPPELILNWDQSGIKFLPFNAWTMAPKGSKRVEMIGLKNMHQIAGVFCESLASDFLPVQLIYKGRTNCCHPSKV